jgi:23S rRNA pseudouridine1911/1915/1917 synthase
MSPSERHVFVVPADLDGERVDRAVAAISQWSRARVKGLIEAGAVTIDGTAVKASHRVAAGTAIAAEHVSEETELAATDVGFGVALETERVIVVDKPAGLVVHPGSGHRDGTLLNGLLFRYPQLRDLGDERRYGLLHRLDRDTSGLLAVARDAATYDDLRAKLAARDVVRHYLTLVMGHPAAATGTIDAPISRDPSAPIRNMVRAGGRQARTHYRRLAEWDEVSLLAVTLETGRTHQIRVHLRSIDLPVVGDRTYGRVDDRFDPGRTFLHAAELAFTLADGTEHTVTSPLPDDLAGVLRALGPPMTGDVPP